MKSTSIAKAVIEKEDQEAKALRSYSKPTLIKLGRVTDLTTGGSGHFGDITGPTTSGNKVWH